MDMKIVGVSVAVLVSLVVLAGVLMPVLDDATTVEEKFTNEGIPLSKLAADTSLSVSWDHTNPDKVTVGSNTIEMESSDSMTILLGSENFYCQWFTTGTATGLQFYTGDTRVDANLSNNLDMNITIASGSVSVTNGSVTKSCELGDHAFVRNSDGSYVMKNSAVNAKILGDTEINVIKTAQIASGYPAGIFATGTVEDGLTYSAFFYNPSAVTFGDSSVTSTAIEGFINLYDVEKLTVPATQGGSSSTITTTSFIVPMEVTAEKSVHLTDGQNGLLATIPVLIIVAILLGVLAAIIIKRQ